MMARRSHHSAHDACPARALQALKIPQAQRHKEISGLLAAVLGQLERDKPKVAPLDPDTDK